MKRQAAAILIATYLILVSVMSLAFAAGAAHAEDKLEASKDAWADGLNLFCFNLVFYFVLPFGTIGAIIYGIHKTAKYFTGRKKQGPETNQRPER